MVPRWLAAALLVTGVATGCGGAGTANTDDRAFVRPTATPSSPAPASTTTVPTPTARKGVPKSYPLAEVPLLDGRVEDGAPSSGNADQGWILQVVRAGSASDCFRAAEDQLVAHGFAKQAVVTNDGVTRAQFTSAKYAVLVTADSLPRHRCHLQYTVGALGG